MDSEQRIIYTHYARETLLFVDNPDAYEEDMGEKPQTVEAQAYYAMLQDVMGHAGDLDELAEEYAPKDESESA